MSDVGPWLPTRSELRAITRRYRASRDQLAGVNQPPAVARGASDWAGVVADPFESVDDTLSRLREVEARFRDAGDRRSVFLTVYIQMTSAVRDGLDAGFFDDATWVRRYLVTFANHYRRALLAYDRGARQEVPPPWRIGFDASLGGDTLVLQDALLGVNAHINYDLTYTLKQVGIDPNRRRKHADHDRINDILARLVDTVQDALVSVYAAETVADLDALFGALDEQVAYFGLKEGRRFAWENAVLLTDFAWPFVTGYVDWRVRSVSTGAAYVVLSPPLDRSTRRAFADAEARVSPVDEFRTAFSRQAPDGNPASWSRPR